MSHEEEGPEDDPSHAGKTVSRLAWERHGIPQEELDKVDRENEVWSCPLKLQLPRPDLGSAEDNGCNRCSNIRPIYRCVRNANVTFLKDTGLNYSCIFNEWSSVPGKKKKMLYLAFF